MKALLTRTPILIAAGIMLVLVLYMASGQFGRDEPATGESAAGPAPAAPASELPKVRVVTSNAVTEVLDLVVAGRTEASRQVEVRAETAGRIIRVLAKSGARVGAGQPLIELDLDDRKARLAESEAHLRQRQIEYDAAVTLAKKGFRSETAVAAARAQLDAAQAVQERMRLEMEKTVLRAPFAGIVAEGHREVGDYVKVGDTAAVVVALDPIKLVGFATEHDVGSLTMGAAGTARLVDGSNVNGKVSFVASTADAGTRTYRFELDVANPAFKIRDGLTAQIAVPARKVLVHRIPSSALSLASDGQVGVKLVGGDGVVVFAAVQILADMPAGLLVGGLPPSATLIVVGQEFVAAGQKVQTVAAEPASAGGGS